MTYTVYGSMRHCIRAVDLMAIQCNKFLLGSFGTCCIIYTGPNMFGAGANPGVDILLIFSPQVGQPMHQQPLNNGR